MRSHHLISVVVAVCGVGKPNDAMHLLGARAATETMKYSSMVGQNEDGITSGEIQNQQNSLSRVN
jgi:hypothetical protein